MTGAAASAALEATYTAARALMAAQPELRAFAEWPTATATDLPPQHLPASDLVQAWEEGQDGVTASLHAATRAAAPFAHWRRTYTEEEVGADFLRRYGWFELLGPSGHYHSDELRAYIGYWGEGLHYPIHSHEAEEIYFVLAGEAVFETDGLPTEVLGPGQSRRHLPHQPHAMTTTNSPLLVFALWRGAGMAGRATLGKTSK